MVNDMDMVTDMERLIMIIKNNRVLQVLLKKSEMKKCRLPKFMPKACSSTFVSQEEYSGRLLNYALMSA